MIPVKTIEELINRHSTLEKELLAIVETLKEFCNILLGQEIIIYTDHKNLTYKVFNTEHVMRWLLICKEFGPKLVYLKGKKNIIADAISRLKLKPTQKARLTIQYWSIWTLEN